MFVEEMKFCKVIISVFPDIHFFAVLPLPTPLLGGKPPTFREVSIQNGMYNQGKIPVLVGKKVTQVLFNLIFEQKSRRYLSSPGAGWAHFLCIDVHLRLHTLPGDLHEAKL